MSTVLSVLGAITGLLFPVCWVWGIVAIWKRTASRRRLPKVLWRLASIFLPIGGVLLFALTRGVSRGRPDLGLPIRSKLVMAHLLLLAMGFAGRVLTRASAVVAVERRVLPDFSAEWWQDRSVDGRPDLCLAMSGGGIRSAAFNIGVLGALHERGLLRRVDVISSVSGGSYAMSWLLLQQYFGQTAAGIDREQLLDRMFIPKGRAQGHLRDHARQFGAIDSSSYYIDAAVSIANDVLGFNFLRAVNWVAEDENRMNVSASRTAYRESLQRTFQLFPHPDSGLILNRYRPPVVPDVTMNTDVSVVTKVSFKDLARFAKDYELPFFVFNATVDVADAVPSHDEGCGDVPAEASEGVPLWPRVFELNGWGLGSDSYGYRAWETIDDDNPRFAAVRLVNVAPAISGAAVSPVALRRSELRTLLWLSNADLGYLVPRFGMADRGSLYLSDGGHSENLGVYSLVRRGCRNIIVVDAEHEPCQQYRFSGYRSVRDAVRGEMGVDFQVPLASFQLADPVLIGTIQAVGPPAGPDDGDATRVAYIKLAMDKTGTTDYPESVKDVRLGDAFPQDPTGNQNFGPYQFEAYRDLGHWIVTRSRAWREFEQAVDSGS